MAGRQPRRDDRAVRNAVRRAVRPDGLLPPNATVIVAVSGGPDSMALLHALASEAPHAALRLRVAHLHHGLRGLDADADAAYVEQQARALSLPVSVGHEDVTSLHPREGGSLEALARRVRYQFLARVAREQGADRVAVAHTASDQAETVLLRLLRGTGVGGLAAMVADAPLPFAPPETRLRVVRPLLDVTRAQVEAYCSTQGIAPRRDASNDDPRFLRNRIRHELLPFLQSFNPNIVATLDRLARHAADDDALLDTLTERTWAQVARLEAEAMVLSVRGLRGQPPALQTRLVRRALGLLRGGLEDADTAEVDTVLALLAGSGTRETRLAGGLVGRRSYDRLLIAASSDAVMDNLCAGPPVGPPIVLQVPGLAELPGWHVTAEEIARPTDFGGDPTAVHLDADRLGPAVSVRAWRAGDRIQPLGMTGHRKLQDVFTDARIPALCRDRIPVIEGGEGIAWVAGLATSQVYRVTPETRQVVKLTARRKLRPNWA